MTTPLPNPNARANYRPAAAGPPTKHQQAVMIWLAVFPTLTVLNLVLGDWLRTLTPFVRTLVLSTIAVPIVIYALMPQLHRLRRRLLTSIASNGPTRDSTRSASSRGHAVSPIHTRGRREGQKTSNVVISLRDLSLTARVQAVPKKGSSASAVFTIFSVFTILPVFTPTSSSRCPTIQTSAVAQECLEERFTWPNGRQVPPRGGCA